MPIYVFRCGCGVRFEHLAAMTDIRRTGLPRVRRGHPQGAGRLLARRPGGRRGCRRNRCHRPGAGSTTAAPSTSTGCAAPGSSGRSWRSATRRSPATSGRSWRTRAATKRSRCGWATRCSERVMDTGTDTGTGNRRAVRQAARPVAEQPVAARASERGVRVDYPTRRSLADPGNDGETAARPSSRRRSAGRPARAVDGPVRFDAASRAMWSADASNYRRVPIGVVAPRDVADVEAALSVCRAHDVPVLPVGARTSIAGQAVNTAVVLDFMHLNRILEIDPDARTARVEPGVICDALRDAAAPHGLTFGPDPSTHNRCTLGGMIGNNACGSHSVAWGKTVDNVDGARRAHLPRASGCRWRAAAPAPIPDALRRAGRAGRRRRPRRLPRPHPPRLRLQPGPAAARAGRPGQGAGRDRGHVRGADRRRRSGWSSRRPRGRWPCSASPTPTPRPTT